MLMNASHCYVHASIQYDCSFFIKGQRIFLHTLNGALARWLALANGTFANVTEQRLKNYSSTRVYPPLGLPSEAALASPLGNEGPHAERPGSSKWCHQVHPAFMELALVEPRIRKNFLQVTEFCKFFSSQQNLNWFFSSASVSKWMTASTQDNQFILQFLSLTWAFIYFSVPHSSYTAESYVEL